MGQGPRPRANPWVEKKKEEEKKAKRAARDLRDPDAPKKIPQTQESKRVITPEQAVDEAALEQMATGDEFASFFAEGLNPKILITTGAKVRKETHQFAEELVDLFPGAEYRERPRKILFKQVAKEAHERSFTHVIVIGESHGELQTLALVKLPEGPTAVFKITSVRLGKEIHGHGRATCHTPELILNNFVTKLGHRVGRLLVSLFPHVPEFRGRQVVTFHNQRDFIFVRRHRYLFDEGGRRRVSLQEIGPQFTLKLHRLYRVTSGLQAVDPEFQWKPHATNRLHFEL